MHDHIIVLTEFIKSYIYLCADTFNFYKVAMMYFVNLTENGFRDKVLLAGFTKEFFGKEEVAEWIEELNATEITHNFTLEPGVWMAPVVLENKNGSAMLGRRIHFDRMLNFYVTDLFEGLAPDITPGNAESVTDFSLCKPRINSCIAAPSIRSTAFPAPMLQKIN